MGQPRKISVALATYNGEAFLPEQLASLAAQEHAPAELVVTDDASSDGTVDCVERFARTAPFPVHLHRNGTRLGYRGNFMKALSLCRSELVAFCDQDDVWHPRKLAVAGAAFDTPDTLLFFHDSWLIDRQGKRLGPASIFALPPRNPPLTAHSMYQPYGFSMVLSRELLGFSGLWPKSADSNDPSVPMGHDQWAYFLASVFGTVVCSQEKLASYRQHGGNAFGKDLKDWRHYVQLGKRWCTNSSAKYAELARAAHARADILAEAAGDLSGAWRERALQGREGCSRLGDRLARRARLYEETSPLRRAALVGELRRDGAYAADGGFGLGREAFPKDVVFGVVLRPLLLPLEGTASA